MDDRRRERTKRGPRRGPGAGRGRHSERCAAQRSREIECDLLVISGGDAPATALSTQAGASTVYDEARGYFRLDGSRPASTPAGQLAGEGHWNIARESGELAGLEAARALGLAKSSASAPARRAARPGQGRARRGRGPARRRRRRVRRACVRVLLRGRQRQGHPPRCQGGLRLDRAVQALHDGDDGPVPGADVPAAVGPADGAGDRPASRPGRYDDRPAPVVDGAAGRARRAADRAGQALLDPRPPPRARRDRSCGRATGAARTTTATRRARRSPSTSPPG